MVNLDSIYDTDAIYCKHQYKSTTSKKFKRDLLSYINSMPDTKLAIEFGTDRGVSTRLLSFGFDRVITIDNKDCKEAKQLNSDRDNIQYLHINLYASETLQTIGSAAECLPNLVFIDARHEYNFVLHDLQKAIDLLPKNGIIVCDDYGTDKFGVFKACNTCIENYTLKPVELIGESAGTEFNNTAYRRLDRTEGIILSKL